MEAVKQSGADGDRRVVVESLLLKIKELEQLVARSSFFLPSYELRQAKIVSSLVESDERYCVLNDKPKLTRGAKGNC